MSYKILYIEDLPTGSIQNDLERCGFEVAVNNADDFNDTLSDIVDNEYVEYDTAVFQDKYGFEKIAETVMKYPEVESVYLMSGVYDLNVVVKGKTFQEVAKFVAKELSTIESVTSTATHFVLRRYKELDVALLGSGKDERGSYSF